jgi:death on curing protein
MSWRWIDKRTLLLLHAESLAEHGGAMGMRDEGLLDSAHARPLNLAAYETPDIADLAAAYAFGVAKNHPFVDGNKRAAFLGAGLFLALNGYRLTASQVDATRAMLALAASEIDEAAFSRWIRDHAVPRQTPAR